MSSDWTQEAEEKIRDEISRYLTAPDARRAQEAMVRLQEIKSDPASQQQS
ncbi:hypothetical protein [Nonomuraea rubra]|uniref:Uncharacterized protein n=1 Tax=Nonomuraea rubra TaxID=46180 RepID=A0A7X0P6T6_9ACTN|nr:hypothetical protein [Nonomuraea rubra]MBB6556117.1 hypothetical protein [Nonomuraea rubra]